MNTPKNQQQQPTALSSAKKTTLRGLKNVLVQPHEISWPILREEKEKSELHAILTELLPAKKCPAKSISWAKLCRLSKEERSALKKDSQAKLSEENDDNVMSAVILGVNGVTKALEKDNVCSILVDSNVEPLFIVKHIVAMGQNKSIPVLLVPFLKTVTLNKIGFASAALGIKKSVSETKDGHFYELHAKISGLVNEFVKEESPLLSFFADDNEQNSQPNVEQECSLGNPTVNNECDTAQTPVVSKCVYKYRSSCKERAFIPPNSKPIAVEKADSWTEFIAFGDDSDNNDTLGINDISRMLKRTGRYMDIHQAEGELLPDSKDTSSNEMECDTVENMKPKSNVVHRPLVRNIQKTTYIPLKVKRIQGNPKRLKATKIAKSKKKVTTKK